MLLIITAPLIPLLSYILSTPASAQGREKAALVLVASIFLMSQGCGEPDEEAVLSQVKEVILPQVVETSPADGETLHFPASLTVVFNKPMDPNTVQITVSGVSGDITFDTSATEFVWTLKKWVLLLSPGPGLVKIVGADGDGNPLMDYRPITVNVFFGETEEPKSDGQDRFKQTYGSHLTIQWDAERNAPSSINGRFNVETIARNLQINLPLVDSVDAERVVEAFLVEQAAFFRLDPIELKRDRIHSWTSLIFGQFYLIEYQQAMGNVPIKGTRAWVSIDRNAHIFRVGFRLRQANRIITTPTINEVEALNIAKAKVGELIHLEKKEVQLSIWPPSFVLPGRPVIGAYTLVWEIFLWGRVNGRPVGTYSVVDAAEGFMWVDHEELGEH